LPTERTNEERFENNGFHKKAAGRETSLRSFPGVAAAESLGVRSDFENGRRLAKKEKQTAGPARRGLDEGEDLGKD